MTRLALALALATCAFLAPVGVFAFSANKPALRKRFHKIGHPAHALTMVMMTMVTIMVSAPALADWSPKWTCYDGDSCRLSWRRRKFGANASRSGLLLSRPEISPVHGLASGAG